MTILRHKKLYVNKINDIRRLKSSRMIKKLHN